MIGIYKYKIIENEQLYGPGKRLLIFLKGCKIHCDGCINKHLWSFEEANFISEEELVHICLSNNLEGVTLHGGEPLDQASSLFTLVSLIKKNNKTVVLFTGYKKNELNKDQIKVWDSSDIVISGRFELSKRNTNLQFRGSTNQRVYTHKGKYKRYKINDCMTTTILTIDSSGNIDVNGFLTKDIMSLIKE